MVDGVDAAVREGVVEADELQLLDREAKATCGEPPDTPTGMGVAQEPDPMRLLDSTGEPSLDFSAG